MKNTYERNIYHVKIQAPFISYTDENDIEQDVKISDLLKAFINHPIEFSVSLKSDEDLDLIISEGTDE